jgi:hypothetical protein
MGNIAEVSSQTAGPRATYPLPYPPAGLVLPPRRNPQSRAMNVSSMYGISVAASTVSPYACEILGAKIFIGWCGHHLSARSRSASECRMWRWQSSVAAPGCPFPHEATGSEPSRVRVLNQLLCARRPKGHRSGLGFEGRSRAVPSRVLSTREVLRPRYR